MKDLLARLDKLVADLQQLRDDLVAQDATERIDKAQAEVPDEAIGAKQ